MDNGLTIQEGNKANPFIKQLVKIGESKMFYYVTVDVNTGNVGYQPNSGELQKSSINNGASGSPHGILAKRQKCQLSEFLKYYKTFDRPTKKAIDRWAKSNPQELNRCININTNQNK